MNIETLTEDGYLSSPASTPDAFFDEEKCLVKQILRKPTEPAQETKWQFLKNIPIAILAVSIFQVFFHILSTAVIEKYLRFEPGKPLEIWRYATYMFVHEDWSHLALNVLIQCGFASLLEANQGRIRVLFIYALGGMTGVLGAACLHPAVVVGASGGGYSLLLANVAVLILNFNTISYKIYRTVSISIIVLSDISYNIIHVSSKKAPQVSWQAHFFGGLTGLFLGLVIFKCKKPNKIRKILVYMALGFYLILVICCIGLTIQIEKCTPLQLISFRYVYSC
ncbi:unnamed protein product [Ceutorhynchus assimilis]|uniref:Peptidase S54 rhomboid domain-containing protein n=1 Tax=Ceutorhynchus assimilis TaxID=467358 RepID=A0A9N9MCS4_9CUCU|nr:unnamed protein product [Ceutorhynchus assimilis]